MMHDLIRTQWSRGLLAFVVMALCGCSLGAGALQGNRPAYNSAVQRTEKDELLLNLLRLRYGDPMKFLHVASIVSSFSFGADMHVDGSVPFGVSEELRGPNVIAGGAGVNYGEAPTITFVPLEGQEFVSQLLEETSVSTLIKLIRSGWSIGRVMPLVVDRFGVLFNRPDAAGLKDFNRLMELLSAIQSRGDLVFIQTPHLDEVVADNVPASALKLDVFDSSLANRFFIKRDKNGNFQLIKIGLDSPVMHLRYVNEAEADMVTSLLRIKSKRRPGELVERIVMVDSKIIPDLYPEDVVEVRVWLRSFSDQLFHVSSHIPLPAGDELFAAATIPEEKPEEKRVDVPPSKASLGIRHSRSRPSDAFVAVPYRGHWFSIDDRDWQSKMTFSLLLTIFSLQTTGGGAAPSLTLPVGG